ncbi:hypothetical protein I6I10_06880 [Corynebacterium glucuronolyticum]|uniref:Uncharacterized protein n=1 Tax=Corynebacterium glucuronolyticum TaxID=39791 RepID=A0A7T4EHP4_9CORY|nr:hypothetical protein [Corynebacterium glucuronolyticum]QQB47586.1 hypothetical protein I6I10_06880 [Corynebacterium glucuronolyticum]WKD64052.1 hypothetical protein CGLUCO_09035 [Corynebacterium glucuronolyticum DSM 44120]SMB82287.1 hypothetical protein SAMN05660745_02611 [Corynebacterium glucuronolyticum]
MKKRIQLGDLPARKRLAYAGRWAWSKQFKRFVLIIGDTGDLTAIANPGEPITQYVPPKDIEVPMDMPPVWEIKQAADVIPDHYAYYPGTTAHIHIPLADPTAATSKQSPYEAQAEHLLQQAEGIITDIRHPASCQGELTMMHAWAEIAHVYAVLHLADKLDYLFDNYLYNVGND